MEQYRLRLGDGTMLGVDHDGLHAWRLDEKAMVQAPGSHRWRPVRQVLADPTPEEPSSPSLILTLADSTELVASTPAAPAPTATSTPDDELPIIPFKPLDDEPEQTPPELELLTDTEATPGELRQGPTPPGIPPAVDAAVRRVTRAIDFLIPLVRRCWQAAPSAATIIAAAQFRRHARAWGAALLVAGLVAAVSVATITRSTWMPVLFGRGSTDRVATTLPPAPPPVAQPLAVPKEVEEAVAKLPHLSLETVQLVLSRSEVDVSDLPSLFRRAHEAAHRGAPALTEDEAKELRTLKGAAASALGRRERQRVRAYDRVSPVRHLLVGEDAKVMGLFTRGVRALSPPRRERLQALLGKTIAADFERRRAQAAEARAR